MTFPILRLWLAGLALVSLAARAHAPAAAFKLVLERQAIPYEKVAAVRTVTAESCTLLRIKDDFDDAYSRYEGRQIVRREVAAPRELPAGTLLVPLADESAVRAALVLEPTAMYGPCQYPRFRALVTSGQPLPVLRVVAAAVR